MHMAKLAMQGVTVHIAISSTSTHMQPKTGFCSCQCMPNNYLSMAEREKYKSTHVITKHFVGEQS